MTAQTLIGMLHHKVTLKMEVNVKDRKREGTLVQRLVSIGACALGVSRDPAPPEHRPDGVHILG